MTSLRVPAPGRRSFAARLGALAVPRRARRLLDLNSILARRRFVPIRAAFYERLWAEAAAEIGALAESAGFGLTRITREGRITHVARSRVPLDDPLTSIALSDKAFTHRLFTARGLPLPRHLVFTRYEIDRAEAFLATLGAAAVVKPAAGTGGGLGVTTGVTDARRLRRAVAHASGFGPTLLIEEEVAGASWRLLYLDGACIDVVRRDPPGVTGDGHSSIRRLVAEENRRRLNGPVVALSPLRIDADMRNTLAAADLSLSHVPPAGRRIVVKGAVNENAADENHSLRDEVHPDLLERIGEMVRGLSVCFAGVDLIGGDLARPLAQSGTVINEINVNPGIHHHELVADPARAVPVPRLVLEHVFRTGRGVMDA